MRLGMQSVKRRIANDGLPYTMNEFLGFCKLNGHHQRNIAMVPGATEFALATWKHHKGRCVLKGPRLA